MVSSGIITKVFFFQAYEMFVAGYSFHVLNNAFVSHWGFQEPHGTPQWRVDQVPTAKAIKTYCHLN
jgi:hypothetical protein